MWRRLSLLVDIEFGFLLASDLVLNFGRKDTPLLKKMRQVLREARAVAKKPQAR
jgi:hypothetical protein